MQSCVDAHVHVKSGMFTFQVIEMHERINVHFLVYSCYSKLIPSTYMTNILLGENEKCIYPTHLEPLALFKTILTVPQRFLQSAPNFLGTTQELRSHPEAVPTTFRKAPNPASCIYYSQQIKKKKSKQILLYYHLHICQMLSQCFGVYGMKKGELLTLFLPWTFLYADFSYYSITSWQNNAWQELIKNCNMNPCRAHWGKFVIGTVFLCLHEQKLGLTVSLISSSGSVWTHCYSVWLFLQFSLW